MNIDINDFRYGVRPAVPQAGRVPSPVPQMGSPLLTAGHSSQRRQVASCASTRSPKSSGKERTCSKILDRTHTSESRVGDKEEKLDNNNFGSLNIVQFNICGPSTKKDELKFFLHSNKIQIALLQETQHTKETDTNIYCIHSTYENVTTAKVPSPIFETT